MTQILVLNVVSFLLVVGAGVVVGWLAWRLTEVANTDGGGAGCRTATPTPLPPTLPQLVPWQPAGLDDLARSC